MIPGILFVDDDEWTLNLLRKTTRDMRRLWAMEFAQSGEEALDILAGFPCDVVVTDMQMPGMNGAELLDIVEKTYPEIIRIVLSGNYDQSSVFRLVRGEHQFLAKPCDLGLLIGTINASLKMRDMMAGDRVREKAGDLVDALNNLTDTLNSRGVATHVEIPEDVNTVITESGLETMRPIVAGGFDPEAEQELDDILSYVSRDRTDRGGGGLSVQDGCGPPQPN